MQQDKIKVIIVNRQSEVKVPTGIRMLIRRCCNAVLKLENFKGSVEVTVMLVDNPYIQELNRQYREKDVPTDILAFPMTRDDGRYEVDTESGFQILGDIVISLEKVMDQCKIYGSTFRQEIAYLTAHGVLHLLGYDHEKSGTDRSHMREREERVLDLLGFKSATSFISSQNLKDNF